MAIAHVQSVGANSSGAVASIGVTFGASTTSGNIVCVGLSVYQYNSMSVSDGVNTYTEDSTRNTGGDEDSSIFRTFATTTATLTVTATPGSARYMTIGVAEFSGVDSGATILTNSNRGSSTTPTAGSVTPAGNGALVFAAMSDNATTSITPDGGFTTVHEYESSANMPGSIIYQIQPSAGAINPGWTLGSTSPWSACVASYEAIAGGGGGAFLPLVNGGLVNFGLVNGGLVG